MYSISWCICKLPKNTTVCIYTITKALRAPVDSAIDLVDQPEYERQVAILQAQLGETDFSAMWAEGQAMTLEQVIEYALVVAPG